MDICCPCGSICTCKQCSALSGCHCKPEDKCECPCTQIVKPAKPVKTAGKRVATLEPSDEFLNALVAPWERPDMPFEFVMELALPWTGAIQEYVDVNEEDLKNRYIQHRLVNIHGARDEKLLAQVQAEADNYLENIMPQKMLELVSLEQAGYPVLIQKVRNSVSIGDNPDKMDLGKYEEWVNIRLNPRKLDSLADAAIQAAPVAHKAALLQVAARIAIQYSPLNLIPVCPECGQPEGECYGICPTQDPFHGDQRAENEDYEFGLQCVPPDPDPYWNEG
jgi:hypothetical protein